MRDGRDGWEGEESFWGIRAVARPSQCTSGSAVNPQHTAPGANQLKPAHVRPGAGTALKPGEHPKGTADSPPIKKSAHTHHRGIVRPRSPFWTLLLQRLPAQAPGTLSTPRHWKPLHLQGCTLQGAASAQVPLPPHPTPGSRGSRPSPTSRIAAISLSWLSLPTPA